MVHLKEELSPEFNVKVTARRDGKLIRSEMQHNVVTNYGREWISKLWGSMTYPSLSPHDNRKLRYVGLGCGGALQTRAGLHSTYTEQVTVSRLEDAVPYAVVSGSPHFLLQLHPQDSSSLYFPTPYRARFIVDFLDTHLSFVGNTTASSGTVVGTNVPVSEVALYLSDAVVTNPSNIPVAYNIFSPIPITPGVTLRIEWEWRV